MRPASLVELAHARRIEEDMARPLSELPRERYQHRPQVRALVQVKRRCILCGEWAETGIRYCLAHALVLTPRRQGSNLARWKAAHGVPTARVRAVGVHRCLRCQEVAEEGISYCLTHALQVQARKGSPLALWKKARDATQVA